MKEMKIDFNGNLSENFKPNFEVNELKAVVDALS